MSNFIKQLVLGAYRQLDARKELYHLRDQRAWRPVLRQTLFKAARTWPKVLPDRWKPRIIIDVGAHTGDISRQLSELYHPEFLALIEPLPDLAGALQSISFAPRQKVFPCALGSKPGRANLNVLANTPSSSLLEPLPNLSVAYQRDMHQVRTVEVEVRTLDDVFGDCRIEHIDLLKVDVEGYEVEVFKGGRETLSRTHLIVVEVVFFEAQKGRPLFKDVYDYLRESRFELRGTTGYMCDDRGLPLQCDALFINRDFVL